MPPHTETSSEDRAILAIAGVSFISLFDGVPRIAPYSGSRAR